jgi:uncharacterized protein (DUF885 family)
MRTPLAVACLTLAIACQPKEQPATAGQSAPGPFSQFADAYFDSSFAFSPSAGTAAGFHQYDSLFEDRSAAAVTRRIATLHAQLSRLDTIRTGPLSSDDSIDAAFMDGNIRSELQDLDVLASWRANPVNYVGAPGNAVDLLMKRNFAPPAERLRSLTARLRQVPAMIAAMKANINNPPVEFTDLAMRVASGSVGFFQSDVARWAKSAAGTDTSALRAFTVVNDSVIASLKDAATWLTDLKPKSHGSFAIGAKNFSDKLKYDEMIDMPLDRVLAIGQANLDKDYTDFVTTAALVAPGKTPHQAFSSLEKTHPTAATLIPSTQSTVAGIRQFLVDHQIVDIPSETMPIVTETPPYARNGSTASMDSPGPFETKATEAFYYVTPPEKSWDAQHIEEHLRQFNPSVMNIVTIHEVFPGHYLQFLYSKQFPTKTRKLLAAGSNVEGWAHYTEQMMVENGYGNGDPKTHLAQLEEALLRDCRYVVGIKEHTQGMSVNDGAKLFVDKCFQEPANGYEEARRGAYNPTYLYYTLGKLAIYKLRADYQRAKGSAFSQRDFHDQFVKQGGVPIPIIRHILLPGDTASAL